MSSPFFFSRPPIVERESMALAWTRYVSQVMTEGSDGWDGSERTKELFNVSLDFASSVEFDTLHRSMDSDVQRRYSRKLLTPDIDKDLGGSYGKRLQESYGFDQLELMVQRLADNPWTKNCCANLLHPPGSSIEALMGMTRTACLKNVQLLLREGELHLVAEFRSQNVMNSHGNFKALHLLHRRLCNRLVAAGTAADLGMMIVTVRAAHVYERDFDRCAQVAEAQ